jgi:hypothetical protein
MTITKRLGLALSAVALVAVAACGDTVRGEATAPSDVEPLTTTTTTTTRTTTTTPTSEAPAGGSNSLPPQAFEEVRAAGIEGSDDAIAEQIALACIMAGSSFNDSVQDVVDVLIQMGSTLSPEILDVIVRVGVKYECPEEGTKLGI